MRITKERYAEMVALVRAYLGPKGAPTDDAEVLADLRDESIPQNVLIGVINDLLDQMADRDRDAALYRRIAAGK